MPALLKWIGVVVTLGLIGVSLFMNFLFGWSLGRSDADRLVYGLASVCADGFKVILPFGIMYAWTKRRILAAGVGVLLWAIVTTYSLTSSLGHSATNRAETAGAKMHHVSTYKDLRRTIELRLSERERIPPFRSVDGIVAEIRALEVSRDWLLSDGCKDARNRSQRLFCDGVIKLQSELASAKRAKELDAEISQLRMKLAEASAEGQSGLSDAQTAVIGRLSGMTEDWIRLALTVLVSIMVELGSGLGLYVMLGHERMVAGSATGALRAPPTKVAPKASGRTSPPILTGPSNELLWRRERLVEDGTGFEAEIDLYRNYCQWIVENRSGPALTLSEFRDWLASEAIGVVSRNKGRNYYSGVQLRTGQQFAS